MANTSCGGCLFNNINDKECYFDIPEIIRDTKKVTLKNDLPYIEDYSCRYCFSKNVYEANPELKTTDIVQIVLSKAKIRYYLVIDINNYLDSIESICDIISKLDIKPQYISFLNKDKKKSEMIAKELNSKMPVGIGWKLHNFIADDKLQDCITVSLDTNIQKTDADLFLVYDPSSLDFETLNNRINFLQIECVVKQTKFNAAIANLESIDGLAISFSAYKFLILNIDHDIMNAIQKEKEFTYIYYDNPTK